MVVEKINLSHGGLDVALERVAQMVVFSPCPNSTPATLGDAFHVEESRIHLVPGRSWRIAAVAASGTLPVELDVIRRYLLDTARAKGADIPSEGVVVVPSWVLALFRVRTAGE